ncbi:MAG: lipid-A-disaccharide synthase [Candidatus Omnitrophica bacterium]|nr:lipid-A-disaccharide synthase [Candidatus Omnitrophota bacterium]
MSKKIFLVAGEPSGDLHASRLAKEIKKTNQNTALMGIGGPLMAREGVKLFYDSNELAIVGVSDVIKNFATIKRIFTDFVKKVMEEKADLVILVDYPGFNIRMAKALKSRGVKVLYYISPQVWAWGKWRINKIKKYVDKILVLFDFEADLYKKSGVPAEFVGHPLLDIARSSSDKEVIMKRLSFDKNKKTVTLLPGSRKREIDFLLPAMAKACDLLYRRSNDIQFVIVRSSNLDSKIFDRYLQDFKAPHRVVENKENELYDCLSITDLAIAASGTVTLECAIMNVPMVIIYKVSLLNAIIMKPFMSVSSIGLVNVLAGKKIVPELIQYSLTVGNLYREASEILFNPAKSDDIKKRLRELKETLGKPGASSRAARSVVEFMNAD